MHYIYINIYYTFHYHLFYLSFRTDTDAINSITGILQPTVEILYLLLNVFIILFILLFILLFIYYLCQSCPMWFSVISVAYSGVIFINIDFVRKKVAILNHTISQWVVSLFVTCDFIQKVWFWTTLIDADDTDCASSTRIYPARD
jgi:hypothetical protein